MQGSSLYPDVQHYYRGHRPNPSTRADTRGNYPGHSRQWASPGSVEHAGYFRPSPRADTPDYHNTSRGVARYRPTTPTAPSEELSLDNHELFYDSRQKPFASKRLDLTPSDHPGNLSIQRSVSDNMDPVYLNETPTHGYRRDSDPHLNNLSVNRNNRSQQRGDTRAEIVSPRKTQLLPLSVSSDLPPLQEPWTITPDESPHNDWPRETGRVEVKLSDNMRQYLDNCISFALPQREIIQSPKKESPETIKIRAENERRRREAQLSMFANTVTIDNLKPGKIIQSPQAGKSSGKYKKRTQKSVSRKLKTEKQPRRARPERSRSPGRSLLKPCRDAYESWLSWRRDVNAALSKRILEARGSHHDEKRERAKLSKNQPSTETIRQLLQQVTISQNTYLATDSFLLFGIPRVTNVRV